MTIELVNLVAYSVQFAVLAASALALVTLLRLRAPRPSLRFWQAVLVTSLLLPVMQPRALIPNDLIVSSVARVSATAPAVAIAQRGVDLSQVLVLVIAAGVTLRLLRLGLGALRLRRILARAEPASMLAGLTREIGREVGATASVVISNDVETPATVGVRRPVILLPRRVLDLSPAMQRAVVTHEFVHVRRRDWLPTVLDEIWCALLWFHPAARLVASRLSLAREAIADATAIRLTRNRRAYAEALLAFADPQPPLVGAIPFIGYRTLRQRLTLIAQEPTMSHRRILVSVALAAAASTATTTLAVAAFPMSASANQARQIYEPGNGVSLPIVLEEAKPRYTPEAMREKIQGGMFVEAVVLEDGTVGDVTVTQSLDAEYGLDAEAVDAARQWRFEPARKDGKPVASRITIEFRFTLK